MSKKELKRIKDISCDFERFISTETIEYTTNIRILMETDTQMTIEDLFDYFIHTIYTEIEIDKLNDE